MANSTSQGPVVEKELDALALQACSGDGDAFGQIYDRMTGKIFRYLYYRTYHRETAEDLTSLTFMKALERLATYKAEKGSFSGWLYTIARNSLMDHFREKKDHLDIESVWEISSDGNVELDAVRKDDWERLRPYLSRLSPAEREILLLRVWDELSYQDIARVLKKSEAACKMSFSRTIAFLRETMPLALLISFILLRERLS